MLRNRLARTSLVAAALATLPELSSAQTNGTWSFPGSGTWSVAGSWFGSVPNSGGIATFNNQPMNLSVGPTVTLDIPVTLNGIVFNSPFNYVVSTTTAQVLTLAGPGQIDVTSARSSYTLFSGGHTISTPIGGGVGLTKIGTGVLNLTGTNTFTGNVAINGGTVRIGSGDAAFGAAANGITLNNANIRNATVAWTSNRSISMIGSCTFENFTAATLNGVISGSGATLNKVVSGALTLTAANTYSGATNLFVGTTTLSGNGALTSTSAILAGGSIVLDNSATNVNNRLPDSSSINFRGSGLSILGNASAPTTETIGPASVTAGMTSISVLPNASQSATLLSPSLTRQNNSTVFFRGNGLGNSPAGNVANIQLGTPPAVVGGGGAPGTTNVSIIPWAWGAANSGSTESTATNTLVTYGPNGIRPLDANTEHVQTLSDGGTSTNNARLATVQSINSPTTVNSLTTTTGGGVAGAGTLIVTSGAVLNVGLNSTISANLNFGSAEGILNFANAGTVSGAIGGSGGLTKSGAGNLNLTGVNSSYTGTTTLVGGRVLISGNVPNNSNSPFGNSSSPIVLSPGLGGGTALTAVWQASAGTLTIDRPFIIAGNRSATAGLGTDGTSVQTLVLNGSIDIQGTALRLEADPSPAMIINGQITGSGSLTDAFGSAQIINGNNTFAGGIEMVTGTYIVGHDNALGTGELNIVGTGAAAGTFAASGGARTLPNDLLVFNNFTVAGSNPIRFNGQVDLNGGSRSFTVLNTAETELAGAVRGGALRKAGTGVLVLSGANTYTGVTTVAGGVLEIRDAAALGTTSGNTVVVSGAQLALSGGALSSEPVTVGGTGVGGTGALRNLSGSNSLGPITLTGTSIRVDAGVLTTGQISGPSTTLDKDGAGVLSAAGYRLDTLNINDGTAGIIAGRSTSNTTVVNNLNITSGKTLDLNENDMVVNNTSLSTITGALTTGYTNGDWSGNGITSSAAAAASFGAITTALGVATASDSFLNGAGVFSGQSVDATDVLVRYTVAGDANLDGTVNGSDFNILATNFGVTSPAMYWATGDFTYNNAVNSADFNVLASGFGFSLPGSAPGGPDTTVPEPAAIVLIGLSGWVLARRRR